MDLRTTAASLTSPMRQPLRRHPASHPSTRLTTSSSFRVPLLVVPETFHFQTIVDTKPLEAFSQSFTQEGEGDDPPGVRHAGGVRGLSFTMTAFDEDATVYSGSQPTMLPERAFLAVLSKRRTRRGESFFQVSGLDAVGD